MHNVLASWWRDATKHLDQEHVEFKPFSNMGKEELTTWFKAIMEGSTAYYAMIRGMYTPCLSSPDDYNFEVDEGD